MYILLDVSWLSRNSPWGSYLDNQEIIPTAILLWLKKKKEKKISFPGNQLLSSDWPRLKKYLSCRQTQRPWNGIVGSVQIQQNSEAKEKEKRKRNQKKTNPSPKNEKPSKLLERTINLQASHSGQYVPHWSSKEGTRQGHTAEKGLVPGI